MESYINDCKEKLIGKYGGINLNCIFCGKLKLSDSFIEQLICPRCNLFIEILKEMKEINKNICNINTKVHDIEEDIKYRPNSKEYLLVKENFKKTASLLDSLDKDEDED